MLCSSLYFVAAKISFNIEFYDTETLNQTKYAFVVRDVLQQQIFMHVW